MEDHIEPLPAPAGWLEALAESEAQAERGELIPLEDVLQELRDTIARMEEAAASASRA